MRRLFNILKYLVLILLLLLLILFVAFQFDSVQTWSGKQAANYLSKQLGTEVSVDRLTLDWDGNIHLQELYAADQRNDTLAYLKDLSIGQFRWDRESNDLFANEVVLLEPKFYLKRYEGKSETNLQFIIDHFKSGKESSSKAPTIRLSHAEIKNGSFLYHNRNNPAVDHEGVDYNHILAQNIELDTDDLVIIGDSIASYLNNLSFEERSGFAISAMQGDLVVNSQSVILEDGFLRTPKSNVNGKIALLYDQWTNYQNFIDEVTLDLDLKESQLSFNDLEEFAPALKGIDREIELLGKVRGPVSNMVGKDLHIQWDKNSFLRGNISLVGLPNVEETFIDLALKELQSTKTELDRIPLPPFDTQNTLRTPDNFRQLGLIQFDGYFTGFLNDFVAFGNLSTAIGKLKSDIALRKLNDGNYRYKGDLSTVGFDLGKFYDQPQLGKVNSEIALEGEGLQLAQLDAKASGQIHAFEYNGYNYEKLEIDGQLRDNFFKGKIDSKDENFLLGFDGIIDLREKQPQFDFKAVVDNIDFVKLNFLKDQNYSTIAGTFILDGKGSDLESMEGILYANELSYCTLTETYELDSLYLLAEHNAKGRKIELNSDIATGQIEGNYELENLQASIMSVVSEIIPNYEYTDEKGRNLAGQNYQGLVTIHDFKPVQEIFFPQIYVAPNSRFSLFSDDSQEEFHITAISDSMKYEDIYLTGMILDLTNDSTAVYATLLGDNFRPGLDYPFNDFSVDLRSENDTVYSSLVVQNTGDGLAADVNGIFTVRSNQAFDFAFDRSELTVNDSLWIINRSGKIAIDSSKVSISNFLVARNDQFVEVNGSMSKLPEDSLFMKMEGFDLAILNPYLTKYKIAMEGSLSGDATLSQAYKDPLLSADLNTAGFLLNDYEIGDIDVLSEWNPEERKMELEGFIKKQGTKVLAYKGSYTPGDDTSPIDITANVNELDIDFVNSFVPKGLSDLGGSFTGKVDVSGTTSAIELDGFLKMNSVSAKIDYLNTVYKSNEKLEIASDMIAINYAEVTDPEGNIGFLTATFLHENFANWNFDVFLDTDENYLLALNTTEDMNPLYYGKAYAKGYVNISGFDDQLIFDIAAKSGKGTNIIMPLDNPEEVKFENFITFIGSDTTRTEEEKLDLSGVDLNMSMDITPDAQFQLIFDESVGDIMKGRGTGHIDLSINNLSDFEMYGDVALTEGDYLFTLKNLVNKEFTVAPGGTVSWFGDPLQAILNISTIYRLSTSLYEIMPDGDDRYRNRIPVNLMLNLDGNMLNPNIAFDVELPTADDLAKTRVDGLLQSELERNRQAFALLVLNKFLPPPGIVKESSSNNALADNTSELVTSQINNWLSQISDDFDIGVHYRPGSNITNRELALALSTQLFDERLQISGNFGVSSATANSTNASNFIGDVRLEYALGDDGRMSLLVYNESDDFRLADDGQQGYRQGVGAVYKKEFDKKPHIWCDFKNIFRTRANKNDCEE